MPYTLQAGAVARLGLLYFVSMAAVSSASTFDVFFSYNWRDRAQIQSAETALRAANLRVCVDYRHLTPGGAWITELENAIADSSSVAVFVGANGFGRWQSQELQLALELDKHVIPVFLPDLKDDPPLGFLRLRTWIDLRSDPISRLSSAIRGEPEAEPEPLTALCPYRGLAFFREEDAPLYFGRESKIQELAAQLLQNRFVAVTGPSGTGKSSFLRAGLANHLHRDRDQSWEIFTLVPNQEPLLELGRALAPVLYSDSDRIEKSRTIARNLSSGEIPLRDYARELTDRTEGLRLLLIVDQFEELYAVSRDANEIEVFIRELLDASARGSVNVVIAYRADFHGYVTSHNGLADRLRTGHFILDPMKPGQLRAAIEKPAASAGLQIDSALTDQLLHDAAAEPGNLPLLEFVLRQLWETRRVTLDSYHALGRLHGALSGYADGVYGKLNPAEQIAARRVFLKTIRAGESGQDTRRRATSTEIGEADWAVVPILAGKRLLVTSRAGDADCVEICHEALIRHWQELRKWLEADREFLLWRERLYGHLAEWRNGGRHADLLLPEPLLPEARRWCDSNADDLAVEERDFIGESLEVAGQRSEAERVRLERELESAKMLAAAQTARLAEQRRGSRRLRFALGGVAVALAAATLFLFQARRDRSLADKARNNAEQLIDFMLFNLRDKLLPVGRLDILDDVNKRVDAYYASLGAGGTAEQLRRRAVSLSNRGNVEATQGNLAAALNSYRAAVAIAEQLVKQDPGKAKWQRDLSVSHEKIGDVEASQGNLAAALQSYQSDLAIAEQLAKLDPGNTEWQRDLSVSHNRMGDVEASQGNLAAALQSYQAALAIAEQLAKQDPGNAGWQRDLSVSHENIADVEASQGNLSAALKSYQASLAISEQLAKQDTGNTEWQRDLSVIHEKIGDAEASQGNPAAALQSYQAELALTEQLAKRDPGNANWQRDLSFSHKKLATTLDRLHQPAEARAHAQQCLMIAERLAKMDPTNATWKSDLSSAQALVARLK
jgi:tetratricopeptide (TPR) repeat protein